MLSKASSMRFWLSTIFCCMSTWPMAVAASLVPCPAPLAAPLRRALVSVQLRQLLGELALLVRLQVLRRRPCRCHVADTLANEREIARVRLQNFECRFGAEDADARIGLADHRHVGESGLLRDAQRLRRQRIEDERRHRRLERRRWRDPGPGRIGGTEHRRPARLAELDADADPAAVVHDGKRSDLLAHAVLGDVEVALRQVRDEAALLVADDHVHEDRGRVRGEGAPGLRALLRTGDCPRTGRSGLQHRHQDEDDRIAPHGALPHSGGTTRRNTRDQTPAGGRGFPRGRCRYDSIRNSVDRDTVRLPCVTRIRSW